MEELDHGVERVVVHDLLAAVGTGIARDRHTPVALAGNTPVRALLDHGTNTIGRMRGIPLHMVLDLIGSNLAQTGLVHRYKPLVGGTEKNRMLAAPAVRIAVRDLLLHHKRAALAKELDDVRVGFIGIHAAEGTTAAKLVAHVELAVVVDRHADIHAFLDANVVVVSTVTRRVVDDTGTVLSVSNEIGKQRHALDAIKDGLLIVQMIEDLGIDYIVGAVDLDRSATPTQIARNKKERASRA